MLLLLNLKKSWEYSSSIINIIEENVLILIDVENYWLTDFSLLKILESVTRKKFHICKAGVCSGWITVPL